MKKYIYISLATLSLPLVTFAQSGGRTLLGGSNDLLKEGQRLVSNVIGIAVLLAFLFFVWGVAEFIRKSDDSSGREEGRQKMIWGIIALAVLASIWGIVTWLQGEFGITPGGEPGIFKLFGLGGTAVGGSTANPNLTGPSYDNCLVDPTGPGC